FSTPSSRPTCFSILPTHEGHENPSARSRVCVVPVVFVMVIPFLFAPYGRDWLSANVTLTLRAAGEFFLDVGQFLKVLLESDTTTANLRQKERRCTGGTSLERHRPVAAHRLRQVVRVRDGLRMEAVEN